MINTTRRIRTGILVAFISSAGLPLAAQDAGLSTLTFLGQTILTQGTEVLEDAQTRLNEMLRMAEEGEAFESSEKCLAALQTAVNTGALMSKAFPFSSVHIFEDARGPVGRFRMLIYGQKLHIESYCEGSTLSGDVLPWGNGAPDPVALSSSSFDAAAGLLLLLHAQGAFEAEDIASAPATAPIITPPAGSSSTMNVPQAEGEAMTEGEWMALRVSVQQCWNVGSLSSEALRTTVSVSFAMSPDRRPIPDSLRMTDSSGGSESAARQTYESARRAIIRCGAGGLKVPVGKYDAWKDVELTFDPTGMRLR